MFLQQYLQLLLLLMVTSLLYVVNATVYFVAPDNNLTLRANNSTNTLQHYVSNGQKYFKRSRTVQLNFLTGIHSLENNFIINKEINLTITGNNSVIECGNRQVGISIIKAVKFTMNNIAIVQCSMKLTDIQKIIVYKLMVCCSCIFMLLCSLSSLCSCTQRLGTLTAINEFLWTFYTHRQRGCKKLRRKHSYPTVTIVDLSQHLYYVW